MLFLIIKIWPKHSDLAVQQIKNVIAPKTLVAKFFLVLEHADVNLVLGIITRIIVPK